jgi:membrane protein implicated in regulation of membrane protease activity
MDWMKDVYLVCAVVGGTLLLAQTVLMVLGGHHGGDVGETPDAGADLGGHDLPVDHDAASSADAASFFKFLSLKTVVAFLTFFGLGGIAARHAGWSDSVGMAVAVVAGLVALVAVAFLMSSLGRLQSRGNVELQNAVGRTARVYLRIPGNRSGRGKVTVEVQGRSIEVEAVTAGAEIATGADVRVVSAIGNDALEVAPLSLS